MLKHNINFLKEYKVIVLNYCFLLSFVLNSLCCGALSKEEKERMERFNQKERERVDLIVEEANKRNEEKDQRYLKHEEEKKEAEQKLKEEESIRLGNNILKINKKIDAVDHKLEKACDISTSIEDTESIKGEMHLIFEDIRLIYNQTYGGGVSLHTKVDNPEDASAEKIEMPCFQYKIIEEEYFKKIDTLFQKKKNLGPDALKGVPSNIPQELQKVLYEIADPKIMSEIVNIKDLHKLRKYDIEWLASKAILPENLPIICALGGDKISKCNGLSYLGALKNRDYINVLFDSTTPERWTSYNSGVLKVLVEIEDMEKLKILVNSNLDFKKLGRDRLSHLSLCKSLEILKFLLEKNGDNECLYHMNKYTIGDIGVHTEDLNKIKMIFDNYDLTKLDDSSIRALCLCKKENLEEILKISNKEFYSSGAIEILGRMSLGKMKKIMNTPNLNVNSGSMMKILDKFSIDQLNEILQDIPLKIGDNAYKLQQCSVEALQEIFKLPGLDKYEYEDFGNLAKMSIEDLKKLVVEKRKVK